MSDASVVLRSFDILHAAHVGVSRNVSALRDGRQLEAGRSDLGWERHVNGAIGEYAWAISRGALWRPLVGELDTDRGDVDGVQVRTTTRRNGCLIIRPQDSPDDLYGLAVLELPAVYLYGPIPGHVGKRPEFWRDADPRAGVHQAAYFVPQDELAGATPGGCQGCGRALAAHEAGDGICDACLDPVEARA